jgi:Ni/Fe-hydrogenase 1 B-type cytochrome subunit
MGSSMTPINLEVTMLKRVYTYVWQIPVRTVHFFNWWCIGILMLTGLNMGSPFITSVIGDQFIMDKIRLIHYITAYVFTAVILVRIYWLFVGDIYGGWRGFIPLSKRRWRDFIDTALYYAFLKKDIHHPTHGHNQLASLTYLVMFALFVWQIFTGFALYSQSHTSLFYTIMGGWLLDVWNAGGIRLFHHFMVWIIILFVSAHFYIVWENDTEEQNAMVSSIFSGYKFVEEDGYKEAQE